MKSTYRSLLVLAILLLAGLIWAGFSSGQTAALAQIDEPVTEGIFRGTLPIAKFDVSPPLRDMVPAEPDFHASLEIFDDRPSGLEGLLGPQDSDPLVQSFVGPNLIPTPIVSFDALNNIAGFTPPDPNGDVGPNHIVVMSNVHFAIYDKTGTLLYGPAANNTLWAGFGGDCQTDNSGDPIVLHDQINDRWILSQFTASGPTFFNCIAISTTADPTGTYYRYAVNTGTNFPDYPKYGVWSNAYYISTREFSAAGPFAGVGAYALNIAEVISGDPTPTILSFLVPPGGTPYNVGDGLLPADLDGITLPPSDVEYFMGAMDNGGPYVAPQDALTLWKFTPDFITPANSSFVLANTIPIAAYDTMFSGCSGRNCIPQPGTTQKIDILSYRQRPIWRLAYRNFGTHESLVTNQSVEASPGIAGNRWWEIRSPGSSPIIYQEGTYAPGTSDGIHRWMASVAMDNAGNMAMGYSASDGTSTFPSVWYTGRLASDPLGTMTQGEGSIVNGTGSQTSTLARWGDYTSLTVDPVDDCTFWYVNEYVPTTSNNGWRLRVGAFKFDECGSLAPTIEVAPTSLSSTQTPGTVVTQTLTISNTGDAALNWSIDEDGGVIVGMHPVQPIPAPPAGTDGSRGGISDYIGIDTVEYVSNPTLILCGVPSDIPWVTVSPTNGTTAPSNSDAVAVGFDATGLSVGVYTGTLCITSDDATNPLVTVPLTLTVEAPTYGVTLSGDAAASGLPGDTVSYVVTITNTGNTADTFDLTATGVWTATLADASVTLGAGIATTFTVEVTVPADALAGESDVATVTATSQGDGTATDTTLVTTTAEAVYGVALSADQAEIGATGTTVSYVVTITNTGNTTDTFDLTAVGIWTATPSVISVTLAIGASATFTVDVDVPSDAADDDFDVTTATATSQGDASATDSAALTTTAGAFNIFLPIVHND